MKRRIVLTIIDELNKNSGIENSVSYFLNGGCFLFAKELQGKLGGILQYLLVEHHVILEIDGILYDSSGNVTSKYEKSKYITENELRQRPKLFNTIKH